ncbi:MAG: hypothetical protein ACYDHY_17380 [Acidiferrobacterales bacterium]
MTSAEQIGPVLLGPAAEALLSAALARRQQAAYAAQQADSDYLAVIRALAEVAGVRQAELEIAYRLVAATPAVALPVQGEEAPHADQ